MLVLLNVCSNLDNWLQPSNARASCYYHEYLSIKTIRCIAFEITSSLIELTAYTTVCIQLKGRNGLREEANRAGLISRLRDHELFIGPRSLKTVSNLTTVGQLVLFRPLCLL